MPSSKKEFLFYFCILLLLLISIAIVIGNDIYHGELDIYLPHYLSDVSVQTIIFDPLCELDTTRSHFRARELGNFFNFLDYKITFILFYFKLPIFISIINYLALIITIIFTVLIAKRFSPTAIKLNYLSLILLLTSPAILFSGTLYRTNKIIASLGIFFTVGFLVISYFSIDTKNKLKKYSILLGIYTSTLLASGADEQGAIFMLLIGLVLIYINLFFKTKMYYEFFSVALGLFTYILYLKFFGLWLFKHLNGITPITTGIDNHEIFNPANYLQSLSLFARYFISLFGNIYYFDLVGKLGYLVISIFYVYFIIRDSGFKNKIKFLALIFLSLIYITIVIHIMTLKHSAIFWEDIFTYYPLPIIFIIFSTFLISINYAIIKNKIKITYLYSTLIFMIFFNIISINHYVDIFRGGHLKYFRVAQSVVGAIYSDGAQSAKITNDLRLDKAVPGASENLNYAEQGIQILRKKLNKAQ